MVCRYDPVRRCRVRTHRVGDTVADRSVQRAGRPHGPAHAGDARDRPCPRARSLARGVRRRPDVRLAHDRRAPVAGCVRHSGSQRAGDRRPNHRRRVRCRILSGAQSRCGGRGRRSACALQHPRLARGPRSQRLFRHRGLSRALHRRGGGRRQSAAALRRVRLAGRPRSLDALRHAEVPRGEPRRRRRKRQSARALPAIRHPRGPRGGQRRAVGLIR